MINRVLLIMPNLSWKIDFDVQKDPPMGILSVAAILEKRGLNVGIVDANAGNLSVDAIMQKIQEFKPELIGISCNYSPLNNISLILAQKAKELNSDIIVVLGGNHATASYQYLLKKGMKNIDYIVRGQGEKILLNLINALNSKMKTDEVKGTAYWSNGQIITTANEEILNDLDELPLPAYHLLDMKQYDRYNIISSRGCPYNCNYCASNIIHKRVKYRSPQRIIEEIEHLINNYGYKHFWFSDDTFTSNYKHTSELLDLMIERKLDISWSCLTRVNKTQKDLLEKMKKAKCKYISYGVESGDPDMLKKMDKRIELEEVKNALSLTKQVGIDTYTFFLIGYPGETLESVQKSFDLIKEVKPTGVSFAVVIPLPGTKLWDYLEKNNIISYEEIEWDYLFAKKGQGKYENYAAELATRWCNISTEKLIQLTNIKELY